MNKPPQAKPARTFREDLAGLLNRHNRESESSTPDSLLAGFLLLCLEAFDATTRDRDEWYGMVVGPGKAEDAPPTADATVKT